MSAPIYDAAPAVAPTVEVLEKLVRHVLPVSLRNHDDLELLAKAVISELHKRGFVVVRAKKECICPGGLDAVGCKKHRYGPHAGDPCECICHVIDRQDERDEEDASHGA